MELFVFSQAEIEAMEPQEVPHVIISITRPSDEPARLKLGDACKGVLRLTFLDADVPSDKCPEAELFSWGQGEQVWAFLQKHLADVQRVLVHCGAGVSRSAGVAAAISLVLNGYDEQFFGQWGRYRPNMRVYRTLLNSCPEYLVSGVAPQD